MRKILAFAILSFFTTKTFAQELNYPFPVHSIDLNIEGQAVKMAYMDVTAPTPNGNTVVLFHGKNFNGYYWKDVISLLNNNGYRVIVPDQVGWGKSGKPNIHYSFHLLAANTKNLVCLGWCLPFHQPSDVEPEIAGRKLYISEIPPSSV